MKNKFCHGLAALIGILASSGTALADAASDMNPDTDTQLTDCIIYVQNTHPCTGAAKISEDFSNHCPQNVNFKDFDWGANANAARCMERAREFKAWCGGTVAYSVFRVNNKNVEGAAASSWGTTYIYDGGSRYLNFHD
jgi:hypothetical protein